MNHRQARAIPDLIKAIARTQSVIDALENSLGGAPGADFCCYRCALGDPYYRLERKLERQTAWLEVLRAKAAGKHPAQRGRKGPHRRGSDVFETYAAIVDQHRVIDPRRDRARALVAQWAPRVYTDAELWNTWLATWSRIGSEVNTEHWRRVFGPPGIARGW